MKKSTVSIAAALVILLVGMLALTTFSDPSGTLPAGFVQGNGRIEAEQIDIAPTLAGRVDKVLASEGELVSLGDTLAVTNQYQDRPRLLPLF